MTNATMGALAIADEHITTRRGFEHVGNPAKYQRLIDADETFSGMKMVGRASPSLDAASAANA